MLFRSLVRADLAKRYQHFGLQALLPDRPLDLRTDQTFPGRARMLAAWRRSPATAAKCKHS